MTTNWTTAVYYKLEPLSVRCVNISGGSVTINNVFIDGVAYPFVARHVTDTGELTIDLTELARMATVGVMLRLTDSNSTVALAAANAGYSDPLNYLPPKSPISRILEPYISTEALNMPMPSMIVSGKQVIAEAIFDASDTMVGTAGIDSVTKMITANSVAINDDAAAVVYYVNNSSKLTQMLTPQDCNVRYLRAEWMSRSGQVRKSHYWQVAKQTNEVNRSVELDNIDRQFEAVKNIGTTLTLHLDGLTAYDVWYYSDIITADVVRLVNASGRAMKVRVLTKNVIIPEGDTGEPNSLNIDVEYIRYEGV